MYKTISVLNTYATNDYNHHSQWGEYHTDQAFGRQAQEEQRLHGKHRAQILARNAVDTDTEQPMVLTHSHTVNRQTNFPESNP